jgi:hypothetical protein
MINEKLMTKKLARLSKKKMTDFEFDVDCTVKYLELGYGGREYWTEKNCIKIEVIVHFFNDIHTDVTFWHDDGSFQDIFYRLDGPCVNKKITPYIQDKKLEAEIGKIFLEVNKIRNS